MSKDSTELRPIHVVTYADDTHGVRGGLYVARQEAIRRDVERHRLARCQTYRFKDLQDCPEYKANPEYFALHPHANGHAFKPVILRKALESISNDEYVIYYDCSKFLPGRMVSMLRSLCDINNGVLFWQYGDPNVVWTKKAVFAACGDPQGHTMRAPHLVATWFMFKVNDDIRRLFDLWAELNCRKELAEWRLYSEPKNDNSDQAEAKEFVDNRGDQAILSVLCSLRDYQGFYGAGYGFNRSPKLFVASMWLGSAFFQFVHAVRR